MVSTDEFTTIDCVGTNEASGYLYYNIDESARAGLPPSQCPCRSYEAPNHLDYELVLNTL